MLSAIGVDLFDQSGIVLQADQAVAVIHLREAGAGIHITGIHPHKAAVGAAAVNGNGGVDIVRLVLIHRINLGEHRVGLRTAPPVDDHIQVGQGTVAPDDHIAILALDQAEGVHRAAAPDVDGAVVYHAAIAAVDVIIIVTGVLTADHRIDHQRTIDRQRLAAFNGEGAVQCTFPAPFLAYAGAAGRLAHRCFSADRVIPPVILRAGYHQRHARGDGQIGRKGRVPGQKHRVAGACRLHHSRKLTQLTLVHVPRLVIAGRLVKLGNQRCPRFGHAGIGILPRQQVVAAVKPAVELAAVLSRGGVGLLGALRNRLIQVVTADGAVFRLVRCDAYRHIFAGQVDILDPRGVFAVKLIHFIIPKAEINGLTCFKRNTSRLPSGFTGVIDGLFCINCI